MKNVLLISADFPYTYWQFARAYKNNGMNVYAIGGTPENEICEELRNNLTRYIYCSDMQNINWLIESVGYLVNTYGPIDYIESNNEFWLRNDSIIREFFNIKSGIFPYQLDEYQKKSNLKKYFEKSGVKVAPYLLVSDYESLEKFALKFGFPLFAKPDIGVGAGGNYKITNIQELQAFYKEIDKNYSYIIEVFVSSESIYTFDGIADINSDVVVYDGMVCPASIYEVKKNKADMFYYIRKDLEDDFISMGSKVIKNMGLQNRFFHTEYFKATNDCPGYFSKGDYVGIEVNIRTPGGYTPDLIDFALSTDIYQMLADTVCFGKPRLNVGTKYYACCASRRNDYNYFFNNDDIFRTFKNDICFSGTYPYILSDIMGDTFYMAKFEKYEDMMLFKQYVEKRTDTSSHESNFKRIIRGEDGRILNDRKSSSIDNLTICDKHIDGA